MSNNAVLGPQLWCSALCAGVCEGAVVALVYGAGLGGGEKKCACHLIGTQATDIVSRDEQWPHTSPTHYLLLLLLLAYNLRLLLDFLYPPMAHNLP